MRAVTRVRVRDVRLGTAIGACKPRSEPAKQFLSKRLAPRHAERLVPRLAASSYVLCHGVLGLHDRADTAAARDKSDDRCGKRQPRSTKDLLHFSPPLRNFYRVSTTRDSSRLI